VFFHEVIASLDIRIRKEVSEENIEHAQEGLKSENGNIISFCSLRQIRKFLKPIILVTCLD
jgi:hypothetical protein